MKIGDFIKVKEQDIFGVIVEDYGNKVVIEDEASEFEYPDNRLEFHKCELELTLEV